MKNKTINRIKIEQKFNGTEDLYKYLLKNIDFIGESIGIKIQKSLKYLPFCLIGQEKRIASRGRMVDGIGLCERDEQVNQKTRLSRATKQTTEKNILFYASKGEFIENLGEIILLASQFEIYTVVIFSAKFEISHLDSINWLQEISSEDYEFITCQVDF